MGSDVMKVLMNMNTFDKDFQKSTVRYSRRGDWNSKSENKAGPVYNNSGKYCSFPGML